MSDSIDKPYVLISPPPQYSGPGQPSVSPPASKDNVKINIALFLATIITTVIAGSLHMSWYSILTRGIPYSMALIGILLAHEMGHYLTARHHKVKSSLPYFIPFPLGLGTLGAIIKMRSAPRNRKVLMDIGAMGPLVGVVVALPLAVYGFSQGVLVNVEPGEDMIRMGDSILTWLISRLVNGELPANQDLLMGPVAYAAWLGFFVTCLNLMPAGQFDGGHIIYGIAGNKHGLISHLTFLGLISWGLWGSDPQAHPALLALAILINAYGLYLILSGPKQKWKRNTLIGLVILWLVTNGFFMEQPPTTMVWLVWSVILYSFGLDHPPTGDLYEPLDLKRTVMGWFCVLLFIITFIPRPFQYLAN